MSQVPAHSELGASGMHRWRNCPGSVRLSRGVPSISSKYAEEGTLAHTLAAAILEARKAGKPEPDTFEYDDEMLEMVGLYVDHVVELGRKPDAVQLFEHRFDLSSVFSGCFGTADAVTYYPGEQLLVVTDLKYGAGVMVDAKDNDQLKYYALGAVVSLGWNVLKIRLEIFQPRGAGDALRSADMDIFELWEFSDELLTAAKATTLPEAPLAVGDWCRFCPAAAANRCPLIKNRAKELSVKIFEDMRPSKINYEELAEVLKWLPILDAWSTSVREFAYTQAMNRVKIPGYKLVEKRPTRAWGDEDIAEETLGEYLTPHQMTKTKLLSPAQIEKLPENGIAHATKKELKEIVAGLVVKKSSGFSLVPEDDERKEIKQIDSKAVFGSADENDLFQ